VVIKLALVSMYLVKSNLIPFLLTLVQLSKTDSCGSLRKISNISRARLPRFRKIDSRMQYSLQFLLKADLQCYQKNHSQFLVVKKFLLNGLNWHCTASFDEKNYVLKIKIARCVKVICFSCQIAALNFSSLHRFLLFLVAFQICFKQKA
jgi:hypothetical protein